MRNFEHRNVSIDDTLIWSKGLFAKVEIYNKTMSDSINVNNNMMNSKPLFPSWSQFSAERQVEKLLCVTQPAQLLFEEKTTTYSEQTLLSNWIFLAVKPVNLADSCLWIMTVKKETEVTKTPNHDKKHTMIKNKS